MHKFIEFSAKRMLAGQWLGLSIGGPADDWGIELFVGPWCVSVVFDWTKLRKRKAFTPAFDTEARRRVQEAVLNHMAEHNKLIDEETLGKAKYEAMLTGEAWVITAPDASTDAVVKNVKPRKRKPARRKTKQRKRK